MPQKVLTWYNQQGDRYLTAEEREQRERQRADRLAAQLKAAGIEPEV
ncbi:MAG: hypothetical protein KME17_00040 [Cyanosarcina radialis HA8281-LM2]|jgi:hypothetical protein|nr:hypothetical protein [Cyanosarcina radialis HA8281-LM2]